MEQMTTFFEAVPPDALSVLLQYLSDRPHCEDWLRTVRAKDALTVLMSSRALSTAGRHLFRDLKKMFDYHILPEFCILANVMAPYAETLCIWPPMLRTLNCDQFSALRSVTIHEGTDIDALEKLLAACVRNLRQLGLNEMRLEQRMIRIIARYCETVEALDLRDLSYEGTLGRIWRAVSGNLRELNGSIEEKEFVHIARHCTRLEKLTLYGELEPSFTSAIELLKGLLKLRVLHIHPHAFRLGLSAENLGALLAVCPLDMKIRSGFYGNNDCLDYFRVIGDRLLSLYLPRGSHSFPSDVLPLLVNLEELDLYEISNELEELSGMKSIFMRRMPRLRRLRISSLEEPKILSALARSTSSLLDFTCTLSTRFVDGSQQLPVKASDFTDFLTANKHLQRIFILFSSPVDALDAHQHRVREMALDEKANLIPLVRYHMNLQKYMLESKYEVGTWSRKISNACVLLRNKRTNVLVDGVRYLPSP